jgi:hypothetical protein
MYEYGILKPVNVILRMGKGKSDNNGGNELNWGTLYVYIERSQQNPLYSYYKLTKNVFLKKKAARVRIPAPQ